MRSRRNRAIVALLAALAVIAVFTPNAGADPQPDPLERPDRDAPLDGSEDNGAAVAAAAAAAATASGVNHIISPGAGSEGFELDGRGERLDPNATTDVWALDDYAYTGTFNNPCGGTSPDAGIWVWDTDDGDEIQKVGVIASPNGSRANDVRAAELNYGDILVHSNEVCGVGGVGGFEIYDVEDPENPIFLSHVQTDDVNLFLQANFGFTDFGVHNLWLFTDGDRDYVAATVESLFGNFQIFDITDPHNPTLVGFWGAEQSPNAVANGVPAGVDWVNNADFGGVILPGNSYLRSGFGASANRTLHDVTISEDGNYAYLANWDEGLVLLDISDPANPELVSVALDPVNGSLDGEVNSHSVWPNEDGTIVVEGEEDFSAWEASAPPSNLTMDGTATPGDPTIPGTAISTTDGDYFEANQTGLTGSTDGSSVIVDGGPTVVAIEMSTAAGSPTFADTGTVSGNLVWVGRACGLTAGDVLTNPIGAGDIAVVRRGACEFDEKAQTVGAAGAAAMVLANNNPNATPWSGLRLWDYSDPANPVLASTFDTVCSASTAPSAQCAANGTYSVHNVQVEDDRAYVSWYSDGMLVLDISDPYNPVELARFTDASTNGGAPLDFWGVYIIPDEDEIYGSDRNGGLYVFKDEIDDNDDDDDDDEGEN